MNDKKDEFLPGPADLSSIPMFAPRAATPSQEQNSRAAEHLFTAANPQPEPTPVVAPALQESAPPAIATSRARSRTVEAAFRGQGSIPWDVVSQLRDEVAQPMTEYLEENPAAPDEDIEAFTRRYTNDLIMSRVLSSTRQGGQTWSAELQEDIADAVLNSIFRLGRIQPLVEIEGIENIDIVGYDNVWITVAGQPRKRYPHPVARDNADLQSAINFIATHRRGGSRSFNSTNPSLHLDLPGSARLAANAEPWTQVPAITIRVHGHVDVTLDDYVAAGTMPSAAAKLLDASVRAGLSIMTNGFQSSGKTTLVRALASCIPPHEKIATIETERELYLYKQTEAHPLVISYEERLGEGEPGPDGKTAGSIPLITGVKDGLRHSTDRLIVGEVRGPEIGVMMQAMQSGIGSISTIHSQDPDDAIERMVTLMMQDSANTTPAYCYRQISQSIDLIVQMARIRDPQTGVSTRYLTAICEVLPGEDNFGVSRPVLSPIFEWNRQTRTLEQKVRPSTRMLERLADVEFDPALLDGS